MSPGYDPRWDDDVRSRDAETDRPDLNRGGRAGTDSRDRPDIDPRDVFMQELSLPRGPDREHVYVHEHTYRLRGSETRTLAAVGAFRVVDVSDLRDHHGRSADPRNGDLWNLREQGLVKTMPLHGRGSAVVTLSDRGRDLLEASRGGREQSGRQTFYAGFSKPRELAHDSQVYRAYLRSADGLRERGARVVGVKLDRELKREYQQFLQEHNRGRRASDGRPDRDVEEIRLWALQHDLPCDDGHVHFPDVRVEYIDVDGREHVLDVEVTTAHYRGSHAAAKSRAGFTCYRGGSTRISGGRGAGGGGRGVDPRLAEDFV
jgi:hypothetical protein